MRHTAHETRSQAANVRSTRAQRSDQRPARSTLRCEKHRGQSHRGDEPNHDRVPTLEKRPPAPNRL
eukprot:1430776-Prymnesium_polylepis.1